MSVAVSRPPPQMPAFSRPQHVSTRPRAPPALAPGLIRLPMPVKESIHPRPPRPRQRRPAKLGPDSKGDLELKDDHKFKDTAQILKRSPTKDAGHRKPTSPVATRRTPSVLPKSTTKTSQAETVFDLSDSDIPLPTKTHNKLPATVPTTPKNEPNVKNEMDGSSKSLRSRRGGHQRAPSVLPSASEAVAIPPRRGRGSGRSSTGDPFLSRSVPVSTSVGALPDWDMPPSFGSTTERKTEIDLSPVQSRRERAEPVPWLEAFEDDTLPSTVDHKPQPSPNVHFPVEPPSPTRRNAKPAHRHTRTSSVPSISVNPLMQKESSGPLDRSKDGNVVKYAGGRFQSAPAPTFLPMPSFQT